MPLTALLHSKRLIIKVAASKRCCKPKSGISFDPADAKLVRYLFCLPHRYKHVNSMVSWYEMCSPSYKSSELLFFVCNIALCIVEEVAHAGMLLPLHTHCQVSLEWSLLTAHTVGLPSWAPKQRREGSTTLQKDGIYCFRRRIYCSQLELILQARTAQGRNKFSCVRLWLDLFLVALRFPPCLWGWFYTLPCHTVAQHSKALNDCNRL